MTWSINQQFCLPSVLFSPCCPLWAGIMREGDKVNSNFSHGTWMCLLQPVIGPGRGWGHKRHRERETAAGQPGGFGGWVFWTPQGTEAPRVHGLFSWKPVRIKSLPCGPLCPVEVDKHGWSRSERSSQEKKKTWEQQQQHLKEIRTRDELNM